MTFNLRTQRAIWGLIFISPWIVGTALLFAWPIMRTILLSFQDVTDLMNLQTEWVGLKHYLEIVQSDVDFLPALVQTLRDLVLNVPLILVFSMMMAVLLQGVTRGQLLLRAVFFLPVIVASGGVIKEVIRAGAATDMVSTTIQTFQRATVASDIQSTLVVAPVQIIVDRLSLIIWHTGVQILLFTAGLNSIPDHLYEAARVDGASPWESFWKITLPMISPVIVIAMIYTYVDLFSDPLNPVVEYIMRLTFGPLRLGFGAAMSVVYFALVFLLVVLTLRMMSRAVFHLGERG